MTKKEFKSAMLRGLGRCVAAVQEEPAKHRDAVLWACRRNFAYDAQSEGTRAVYVYQLLAAYADKEPFLRAATEALHAYRPNGGWDLLHLAELLACFARDGEEAARRALWEKYGELLAGMQRRKRRPNRVFHELADLEQLGLVLAVDRSSFLRVAADLGRLYRDKTYLLDGDFAWLFASKGKRYRRSLERTTKSDENIACFLKRELASIAEAEATREQRRAIPPEKRSGVSLSRWLATEADADTVERYARAYREQTNPAQRAEALKVFLQCPYPDDPAPLIADTAAEPALAEPAWWALENIRHPAVRAFSQANAAKGVRTPENFALLVTNYVPADAPLLERLLQERIAADDREAIHVAGMDVFRAFYAHSGIPRPKHLLPLLYEHTPCAYCRESALVYMSRHRMLTEEMLQECLYDCNDNIRRYAAKRLNR